MMTVASKPEAIVGMVIVVVPVTSKTAPHSLVAMVCAELSAITFAPLVNVTAPVDGPLDGHVVENELTPAVALGVAQVPSPLQKVVLDALVPLLRFVTGRFPVTPVVRGNPVAFVSVPLSGVPNAPPLTTNAPAVPVLTPRAVRTPVPVVVVEGATPAPPPITTALAASSPEDERTVPELKYGTPPLVVVPATV